MCRLPDFAHIADEQQRLIAFNKARNTQTAERRKRSRHEVAEKQADVRIAQLASDAVVKRIKASSPARANSSLECAAAFLLDADEVINDTSGVVGAASIWAKGFMTFLSIVQTLGASRVVEGIDLLRDCGLGSPGLHMMAGHLRQTAASKERERQLEPRRDEARAVAAAITEVAHASHLALKYPPTSSAFFSLSKELRETYMNLPIGFPLVAPRYLY